jgi:flagellar hook-associated protein 2
MTGFVRAYNSVIDILDKVSAANPEGQSGALVGDPLPRSIENSLRNTLGGLVGGGFGSLADLGFTTSLGGKLSFDAGAFGTAVEDDPDAVAGVFSGQGSLSAELETLLGGLVGVGGQIEARTEGLTTRLERIDDSRLRLANRLEDVEARLIKQFSAMDALVSQLQSTGSFLTQQLANINNITNPSSRK